MWNSNTFLANNKNRFTRGEDALEHIQKIAAPFVAGYEMTLTSFRMPTSAGAARYGGASTIIYGGTGGSISAQYSILKHGYPFLTDNYGITISLDSGSGMINSYYETLNPPRVGAPVPLTLPIAAIAEAEKACHVTPGTFKDSTAILGWAVPKGAHQAELYWKVDGTSSGASYPSVFVDAKIGKADPRVIMAAPAFPAGLVTAPPGTRIYWSPGAGARAIAPAKPATKPKTAKPKPSSSAP